ncbi:MAG: nitroreductase family protein [Burkholderiales bacterium]|nr:nitroreductase family protein [Burkholderiales bacterium]
MSIADTSNPRMNAHALLQARYGAEAVPPVGRLNEMLHGLFAHRTVRAYLPDALPQGTLGTLVAAAQSAASSSNLQLWSVIAVEDPGRKSRLAQVTGGQVHIEQAPLLLVWLADLSRADRMAAARSCTMEGSHYLESFVVAAIDAALAAQNAVVAAESMGLGTCYIGALRNDPERVAAELGLPPRAMAVFGMCVGREDPSHPTEIKPRLPQTVVCFRERYVPQREMEQVAEYDKTVAAFSREQGMGDVSWSDRVFARLGSYKGLYGRERMRAAMKALGFELR